LDYESLREKFNIDQQKSNKAADTPRESNLDDAQQIQREVSDNNFELNRNLSFMDKIQPKLDMQINRAMQE
jgi:hypothetical protein